MTNPFADPGHWVADTRGDGRGVRVSAHADAGFLVLSTWKAGTCVGTVRLLPDEAAELVAGVSRELARLAQVTPPVSGIGDSVETTLAVLAERLERLEQGRQP